MRMFRTLDTTKVHTWHLDLYRALMYHTMRDTHAIEERRTMKSHARQFGMCPCGGSYDTRYVEVRLTTADKPILLTDVLQGSCRLCGSRVYKPEILERIEALMKGQSVDPILDQKIV
jgi:hypothetical protein